MPRQVIPNPESIAHALTLYALAPRQDVSHCHRDIEPGSALTF
jgi:hypothetical protein